MTSHSNMLSLTRPQLIPGTPLSLCICFSCRLKSPEAAEPDMGGSVVWWVGRRRGGGRGDFDNGLGDGFGWRACLGCLVVDSC